MSLIPGSCLSSPLPSPFLVPPITSSYTHRSNDSIPTSNLGYFPSEETTAPQNPTIPIITGRYFPELAAFDDGGLESLEEYFDRFEHFCCRKYGPDKRQWLVVLEGKLTSEYLSCFKMSGGNSASYEVIKIQLINFYNNLKELGSIPVTNFSSVRYEGEGFYNYMSKLRFLFVKAYPRENPDTSKVLYEKLRDTLPEHVRKLVSAKYIEISTMFNKQITYTALQSYVLSLESCEKIQKVEPTLAFVEKDEPEKTQDLTRPRISFRKSTPKELEKDEKVCSFCKKVGHTEEKCFKKLKLCYQCGSSKHFILNCNKYKVGSKKEMCQFCDRIGHTAKTCWFANPKNKGSFTGTKDVSEN